MGNFVRAAGAYVYQQRMLKSLSAQEVAHLAGVELSVFIAFEMGWMGLLPSEAVAIVRALDLDLEELAEIAWPDSDSPSVFSGAEKREINN